jgi:hypothetical protein
MGCFLLVYVVSFCSRSLDLDVVVSGYYDHRQRRPTSDGNLRTNRGGSAEARDFHSFLTGGGILRFKRSLHKSWDT